MAGPEKRALKRLGRGIVALVISAIISFFTEDPKYIALIPVINGVGKYLRDKVGIVKVPF